MLQRLHNLVSKPKEDLRDHFFLEYNSVPEIMRDETGRERVAELLSEIKPYCKAVVASAAAEEKPPLENERDLYHIVIVTTDNGVPIEAHYSRNTLVDRDGKKPGQILSIERYENDISQDAKFIINEQGVSYKPGFVVEAEASQLYKILVNHPRLRKNKVSALIRHRGAFKARDGFGEKLAQLGKAVFKYIRGN